MKPRLKVRQPLTGKEMFLKFNSQEERREYGGTAFIELQFCVLPPDTSPDGILDPETFWKDDSLYVYSEQPFYELYKDIFGNGIHADRSVGSFDYYGITYYPPEQIDGIIDRAKEAKPEGYADLTGWLADAKQYNGFYILGI